MPRINLSLRRKTFVAQKDPDKLIAKLVSSIMFDEPRETGSGNWKKDIQVWQVLVGDDKKKQQGAAVYLSLQGTELDAVRPIDASVLNIERGLE